MAWWGCNLHRRKPPGGVQILKDGFGGAIVLWYDKRLNGLYDFYIQRVDSIGITKWSLNGVPVCTDDSVQQYPEMVSDGAGGAIIAWEDKRNYTTSRWDVYAQHIDSSGTVRWTNNGMAICTAIWQQQYISMVTDGNGGAIIGWSDARTGFWQGYAQRVNDEPPGIAETGRRGTQRQGEISLEICPNPFSERTFIKYQIPNDKYQMNAKFQISTKIYNCLGQLVRTLVNEPRGVGVYEVSWNGEDDDRKPLSDGVYFCELAIEGQRLIKKLIFLR